MKIAVIGPGALGLLLAAKLQDAGQEVWLLDHRPDRASYLRRHGFRLTSLVGEDQTFYVPVEATPEAIGPCELILMLVKAHQTAVAAQNLPPLLGGASIVLTLQNGIGNLEAMAAVIGWSHLAAGVAFLGVTRLGVNQISLAGVGPLVLGLPSSSQVPWTALERIAAILQNAGFDCRLEADIQAVLWDKLLLNAGINPVTALTRLANGELVKVPEAWETAVAAVQEAWNVAKALGLHLPPEPVARLRQVCQATARNLSSMLQDIMAPRQTEIEAINGQIVLHGQRVGKPTPVNATLTNLVKALEFGLLAPGRSGREKQG